MSCKAYRMTVFGVSDRGLQRANNEDHFIVADLTRTVVGVRDNQVTTALMHHEIGSQGTLLAVADGLGGYAGGAEASRIAVETLVQTLFTAQNQMLAPAAQLARALEQAHHAIRRHRRTSKQPRLMASTLTAMHIGQGYLTIAHVGDSRAYLFTNGHLTLLTEDQTVVNLMRKKGIVTDEEAREHPHRHVLLQALGQDKAITPTIQTHPFRDGDLVLLCTDGLSSQVSHDHIAAILAGDDDENVRCHRLIEAAYALGAADNVTVLLARLMVEYTPALSRTS